MRYNIKRTLAILTATAVLIGNYGSISVYADTFISRFPGSMSNSSTTNPTGPGIDKDDDDANWVDHKDDDRHNIINSNGSGGTGIKGIASGPQSVELSDGSWYWYHQSAEGCTYGMNADGTRNIGAMYLSTRSATDGLNKMACGLYSTAMIISNLHGRPICIDEIATTLGCTINGNKIDISGKGFLDTPSGSPTDLGDAVKEHYGINYEAFSNKSETEAKATIDACLDAGGMVRFRYGIPYSGVKDGSLTFRQTNGHFAVLRGRTSDGKYLVLDSCEKFCSDKESAVARSNAGIDWDTFWKYTGIDGSTGGVHARGFICFTMEGGSRLGSSTTGSTGASSTGDWSSGCTWYGPGSAIANYTDKKDLGEGFYLYNGLPWVPNSNTYTVDTDTALNDWFIYMEEDSGETVKYGDGSEASAKDIINNSNRLKEVDEKDFEGDDDCWETVDNGSYAVVDNLQAVPICVPPIVVDPYFNINFTDTDELSDDNWTNSDTADEDCYDFGESKMAVALYEKSTRKIWFLPVVACDVMDGTEPGGVAKTEPSDLASQLLGNALSGSGIGLSKADYVSTVAEFRDLPDAVKSIIGSTGDYAVCGYVVWG